MSPASKQNRLVIPLRSQSERSSRDASPGQKTASLRSMSNITRIATVMLVVSLGLWGCARKPDGKATATDRVRALESRCVKLEQDYRTVQQARDKAKKELALLTEEVDRLQKELASHAEEVKEIANLRTQVKAAETEREDLRGVLTQRTTERDQLQQQVTARISERDVLQNRCERLRKGLQSLMSQDEPTFGAAPAPVVPTAAQPSPEVGPNIGGQS